MGGRPLLSSFLRAALATAVAAACGCDVDADAARRAFLHGAFIDDHHDLLLRDPEEVAAKWQRMAKDPFQFLRGNIGIWARDVVQPGFFPTSVGDGPSSVVLLVGDPHPENLGTFRRANGRVVVDWNDFDAARYGPFLFDLRRLALAFAVVRVEDDATSAARAVAEGYVDGARHRESPLVLEEGGEIGAVLTNLVDKARTKGEDESPVVALDVVTVIPEPLLDEVRVAVDGEARVALLHALEGWRTAVGAPPVVDVARVIGKGVGSRPLLRYHALLADGRVVEAKEARDPFLIPGLAMTTERVFVNNASRIVAARRALAATPDTDDLLGSAHLPPLGLRVQRETAWQRSLRVADFGAFEDEDIEHVARLAGRLLFHAHARAPGPQGEDLREPLATMIDAEGHTLIDEIESFVSAWKPVHIEDHRIFRALLAEHGPLLGWTP